MEQNQWQICPKCNGTGKIYSEHSLTGVPMLDIQILSTNMLVKMLEIKGHKNECLLCKGKMIISTVTGLPPL